MAKRKAEKFKGLKYSEVGSMRKLVFNALMNKLEDSAVIKSSIVLPPSEEDYAVYYFAVLQKGKVVDYIRVNTDLARRLVQGVEFKEYHPDVSTPELGSEM